MEDTVCSNCQHQNQQSASFCSQCGNNLGLVCSECRGAIRSTDRYCSACGIAVNAGDDSEPTNADNKRCLERRQVTVLFADIVDSTSIASRILPEDYRQTLGHYHRVCTDVVSEYSGYVSQYLGDGVLAVFGYPSALDDDALRAVQSGCEIVERLRNTELPNLPTVDQIGVRVGIATGIVVTGAVQDLYVSGGNSIFGLTASVASRLQSLASEYDVLLSDSTYRLVEGRHLCDYLGQYTVKGIEEPVSVFRARSVERRKHNRIDLNSLPGSLFVGRDSEMSSLRAIYQDVVRSEGRVVFIQGDPGIGKTRLVNEFLETIENDGAVRIETRCYSHFSRTPFHPLATFLRDSLGIKSGDDVSVIQRRLRRTVTDDEHVLIELSNRVSQLLITLDHRTPSVEATERSERLIDGIVQILNLMTRSRTVILVFEDWNWADSFTNNLLGQIVDLITLKKVLIIVTARFDSAPDWALRSHVCRMNVARLNTSHATDLFNAITDNVELSEDFSRQIVRRSDGVPLFVEELAKSILDDWKDGTPPTASSYVTIPETLRDSLAARLDRLGKAKTIIQIGAVVGRQFSHSIVAALVSMESSQLNAHIETIVKSGLVNLSGQRAKRIYQFKHSLIQDAAYDSLVRTDRISLHRQIANHMALTDDAMEYPAELIARHYGLAGSARAAAKYWKQASDLAFLSSAQRVAIQHAEEGLRATKMIGDPAIRERYGLLLELNCQLASGNQSVGGSAMDTYQSTLKRLQALNAEEEIFPLVRRLHGHYLLCGPVDRALTLAIDMYKIALRTQDRNVISTTKRHLGWTYVMCGKHVQGQPLLRQSLVEYRSDHWPRHLNTEILNPAAVGMINLAWSTWFTGEDSESTDLIGDATELAEKLQHPYTLAYVYSFRSAIHQCRNEPNAVKEYIERALTIADKQNYHFWKCWVMALKGWVLAKENSPVQGVSMIRQSLTEYENTGAYVYTPYLLNVLASALSDKGEADESLTKMDQLIDQYGVYLFRPLIPNSAIRR